MRVTSVTVFSTAQENDEPACSVDFSSVCERVAKCSNEIKVLSHRCVSAYDFLGVIL